MKETAIAEKFFGDIGIRCQKFDYANYKIIPCDFIAYDYSNWYITEVKTSIKDNERGILQLLRYYDILKNSKYNKDPKIGDSVFSNNQQDYRTNKGYYGLLKTIKNRKKEFPQYKRDIKLYLYFIGQEIGEFKKYVSIYNTYLKNINCPEISFYYCENGKSIKY